MLAAGVWPVFPGNGDRTRGKVLKLYHRRFGLDIRRHFLSKRVITHTGNRHRVPRDVVESLSQVMLKNCMNMALRDMGHWAWWGWVGGWTR